MLSEIRFSLPAITSAAVLAFTPQTPPCLVFDGSSWGGNLNIKVSGSKVGTTKLQISGTMSFTGTTFAIDAGELQLTGAYSVTEEGKADLVPESTEEAVVELLKAIGWSAQSLEIVDTQMSAQLKANNNGIWLRSNGKIRALATIALPTGLVESKVKLTLKFIGLNPPRIGGTCWGKPDAKSKLIVPGHGSSSGNLPIEMWFGPIPQAPGDNDFVFVLGNSTIEDMTYSEMGALVTISGFGEAILDHVADLVAFIIGGPVAAIAIESGDTSVKHTSCKKARFRSRTEYDVITSLGEQFVVSFHLEGTTVPLDPPDNPIELEDSSGGLLPVILGVR